MSRRCLQNFGSVLKLARFRWLDVLTKCLPALKILKQVVKSCSGLVACGRMVTAGEPTRPLAAIVRYLGCRNCLKRLKEESGNGSLKSPAGNSVSKAATKNPARQMRAAPKTGVEKEDRSPVRPRHASPPLYPRSNSSDALRQYRKYWRVS